jgi:type II secretory pathway pseudopilin PulG
MQFWRGAKLIRHSEEGYILLGVVIVLSVFTIILLAALPKVREEIRRDHEIETMHRGQQYKRAVQLYYRRFHSFPPSIDALLETNGLRFLRKRYSDPLTGKDDWEPVFLGQNRAPLTMGFFGEVRNLGAAQAGNGPSRSDQIVGGRPPDTFSTYAPDPSGLDNGANSIQAKSSDSSSPFGQVPGIGPIIGVSPSNTEQSILIYKTKDHYDEWEFVYDPASDRMVQGWFPPTYGKPPNVGAPGVGPNSPTP